jgi:hypothetical protein
VVATARALTPLRAGDCGRNPFFRDPWELGYLSLLGILVALFPPCRHCVTEVREREPHPIANPHQSRLPAFRGPPWCCRELGVAAAPCAVSRAEDTRKSAVHRGQTICAPIAGKIQVLGASLLPVIVFRQVGLTSTQTVGRIYSPEL